MAPSPAEAQPRAACLAGDVPRNRWRVHRWRRIRDRRSDRPVSAQRARHHPGGRLHDAVDPYARDRIPDSNRIAVRRARPASARSRSSALYRDLHLQGAAGDERESLDQRHLAAGNFRRRCWIPRFACVLSARGNPDRAPGARRDLAADHPHVGCAAVGSRATCPRCGSCCRRPHWRGLLPGMESELAPVAHAAKASGPRQPDLAH